MCSVRLNEKVFSVAAIIVAAFMALTAAGHAELLKHGTAGCSSFDDFKTMAQLFIRKEDAPAVAFSRTHDCKGFEKGEDVLWERFKDGIPCIRGRGDKTCYWVAPTEQHIVFDTQEWRSTSLGCSNFDEFKAMM